MNVPGTAFKRRSEADLDDAKRKRYIYQTGQVVSPSTDMTEAMYPSYRQPYGSQREHAPLTVNPVTQRFQGATGLLPAETSVYMPSSGIEVSASDRNYHYYSHDSHDTYSPERRNSHSPIHVKSYPQTKYTLSYSPSRDSRRDISPRKDSCLPVYYGRESELPYLSLLPVSVRRSHERLDRSVSQSSQNRLDSYSADYYHNLDSSEVKDSSLFSRQYSQQNSNESLQKRDGHSKEASQDCYGLSNEYTVVIENLSSDLSNHDIKDCIRGFDCKCVKLKILNDNMSAVVMFDSYSEAKTMVRDLDQSRFCGRRITVKLQEPVSETYDMSDRQDHYQESERNKSVSKKKEFKDSSLFQSYIDASYADVPILGRKYITEFGNENCSSAYYVCSLCESICSWRSIADHMVGYKHRMKCLKYSHPKVYDELCRIKSKSEMLEKCRKYAAVYVNPKESITSKIVKNPQLEASEHLTSITSPMERTKTDQVQQVNINSDHDNNEEWEKKDSSVSNILKKIEAFKKKVNENKDLSSGHPSKRQRMEVSSSNKETEKTGLTTTAAAEIASFRVQSDKNKQSNNEVNREGKEVVKLKYVEIRRYDSVKRKDDDSLKRKGDDSLKRKNDEDITRRDNKFRKQKDDDSMKRKNVDSMKRKNDDSMKRKNDDSMKRKNGDSVKRKNDEDITRQDNKFIKQKDDGTVKKQYDNEAYNKYYEKQKRSQKHFINEECIGKHDASSFERENKIEHKNKTLEDSRRQAYELQKKLDEERLKQDKGIINSKIIEASDVTLVKETVTVKAYKVVKLSNSEHDALKTIENKSDSQQGTQNKSIERTVQKEVGIAQPAKSKPVYNDGKVVEYAEFLDEGLSNMEKERVESANMEKKIDTAVLVGVNANNMNFSSHPDSKINQFYAEYLKKYPTNSATIGLQYITEILPTMPSRYYLYLCALCDSECSGQSIAQHIVGYKHRMKYLYLHEREMYNTIMSQQTSRQALNYHCMKFVEGVSVKEGPQKIKSITHHEYEHIKRVIKDRMKTKISSLPETMPQPDVVFIPPCESEEPEICQTPHKHVCAIAAATTDTLQSMACMKGLTGAAVSLTNDSTGVAEIDSTTKMPSTVSRSTIDMEPTEIETIEMEDADKTDNKISLNNDIQDKQTAAFSKQSQIADRIIFARFEAKTVKPDDVTKCVWFYKYIQAKAEVPLLGLPYIVEIQGLNSKKPNAPTYICELCCSITKIEGSSAIYTHLLGAKHMEAYIRKHYPHKATELKLIKMKSARSKYLQMQARLICESKEADYIRLAVLNAKSAKKTAGSSVAAINTATSATATTNTRTTDTSAYSIATISSQSQDENGNLQHSASGDNITAQLYDMIAGLHKRPLVGLSYITETQGIYSKLQAKYDCALCNEMINANFINTHLSGLDHRLKFLKANYPILHMKCENNWQMVERYCQLIEEQFGRESISVRKWVYTNPDGTAVYSKPQVIKDPYIGKKVEDAADKKRLETPEKLVVEINKKVDIPVVDVHQSEAGDDANIKPLENPEKVDGKIKKKVDVPAVDRQQTQAIANADIELYKIIQGLDCSPMLGLHYITEVHHPINAQPPKYECSVCNITGCKTTLNTKNILCHLCSRTHRLNFLKENHEHIYQELIAITSLDAQNAALDTHTKERESKVGHGSVQKVVAKDDTYWESGDEPTQEGDSPQANLPTVGSPHGELLPVDRQDIMPSSTSNILGQISQQLISEEEMSSVDSLPAVTVTEPYSLESASDRDNKRPLSQTGLGQEPTATSTSQKTLSAERELCSTVDMFNGNSYTNDCSEENSQINDTLAVKTKTELKECPSLQKSVHGENVIQNLSAEVAITEGVNEPVIENNTEYHLNVDCAMEVTKHKHSEVENESIIEVPDEVQDVNKLREFKASYYKVQKIETDNENPIVMGSLDVNDVNTKHTELTSESTMNTGVTIINISRDVTTGACLEVESHADRSEIPDFEFVLKSHIEDDFVKVDVLIDTEVEIDNESIGIAVQNLPTPIDQVSDAKLISNNKQSACDGRFQGKIDDKSIGMSTQDTPTPLDQVSADKLTISDRHGQSIGIAIQNTPTPLDKVTDDKLTTGDIHDESIGIAIQNIPAPLDHVSGDKFTTTDIKNVYDEKFNLVIENNEITKNVTHYATNDKVVAITEPLLEAGGNTSESTAGIVTGLQCHNIIDTIEDTGMYKVHDDLRKRKITRETEFGSDDQEIHLVDIQKSVNETDSHSGSAKSKLGVVNNEKDIFAECFDIDQLSNSVDINEKIETAPPFSVSSQNSTQLFETHIKPVRLICENNTDPIPFESNNYVWKDMQDNENSFEESLSLVMNNDENLLEKSGYANGKEITQFEVMSVYATEDHNENCDISIVEDDISQKNECDSLMFNTESIDDNFKQTDNTNNKILLHSNDEDDTKPDTEKHNYTVEADFKQNDALTDCTYVVNDYNMDDCNENDDFEVITLRKDNLSIKDTEDLFLGEDFVTQDKLQENCNDDTNTGKVENEAELRSSKDIRQHHYENTDSSNIQEQRLNKRHTYPPNLFIQSPDNSFTSQSRSVESITSDTSLDDIHSDQNTSVMATPISITDNECSTPEKMVKEVN